MRRRKPPPGAPARLRRAMSACLAVVIAVGFAFCAAAALAQGTPREDGFARWLEQLWPEAQKIGITRQTFDAATAGLTPDPSLPDLAIPGRPDKQPTQAEFVQTPAEYLKESSFERLAAQGRSLLAQHRTTLAKVEQKFGVPGPIVLAIWARETNFGTARLPHSAIRALATQAYLGRRKEQFRVEFVAALKMLQDGHVTLANMRSSWAGAMGQPQLLPSGFDKYAVDFDGDDRKDIWNSVPDVLGTIANHLLQLQWQRGHRWAYEVRAPKGTDCTMAQPGVKKSLGEWVQLGFTPAFDRKLSPAELDTEASLLMPAGPYGPAFLTPRNYFALKDYNFSDLYVLFVGHLADRIAGERAFETPWHKVEQLRTAALERMQHELTRRKIYQDKIDGKAGMLTRAAVGEYQRQNRLPVDCWPTQALVNHMLSPGSQQPKPQQAAPPQPGSEQPGSGQPGSQPLEPQQPEPHSSRPDSHPGLPQPGSKQSGPKRAASPQSTSRQPASKQQKAQRAGSQPSGPLELLQLLRPRQPKSEQGTQTQGTQTKGTQTKDRPRSPRPVSGSGAKGASSD
jgi:lytic murein transglycosylase